MAPSDDHETTRREHAADIARLKGDVVRLDGRIDADHEFLEAVNRKEQEIIGQMRDLEVDAATLTGRVVWVEGEVERGSERMAKIEGRVEQVETRMTWMTGAVAALAFVAPFVAALLARLLGW